MLSSFAKYFPKLLWKGELFEKLNFPSGFVASQDSSRKFAKFEKYLWGFS